MKTIQCDLCKRIIGKTVDVGTFQAVSMAEYRPNDFDSGFSITGGGKTSADVCNECSSKICDAQNKMIEEIRATFINNK